VVPSKKRGVILGEPICWRCWATSTGRNEEKWFPRKECGGPLANPISLAASRANGLGRAGMRKTGSFEKSMAPTGGGPGFRSEQRE
jgi:hypothetical protein